MLRVKKLIAAIITYNAEGKKYIENKRGFGEPKGRFNFYKLKMSDHEKVKSIF